MCGLGFRNILSTARVDKEGARRRANGVLTVG